MFVAIRTLADKWVISRVDPEERDGDAVQHLAAAARRHVVLQGREAAEGHRDLWRLFGFWGGPVERKS